LIVIDASVLIDLLIRAPGVEAIEGRLFSDPSWNAPHLVDLEVAQVLRRWVLGKRLDATRAKGALDVLEDLPIDRWPHHVLMPRIWALRENLTAYDAAYVALAEALECVLVTRDARLSAVPGLRTDVESL
jgi:predicted nucleic acid-binding protein